jgi:site-specific DNA-methyltransferase (adenine-specific)
MPTINLYNTDCMEFMRGLPDKAYDLAIVDPPYGIGASEMKMGKGKNKQWSSGKDWDNHTPNADYFMELFRVSRNQIIFGGNYFELPKTGGWIYWNKMRGKDVSFSDGELAWTNFLTVIKQADVRYDGFIGADDERIHPTQKPITLYKWILGNYAKQSFRCGHKHEKEYNHLCDTCKNPIKILDTHGGSMSIAIACHDMGFDLDLCELDKDYFEAGKARFEAHVAKYAPAEEIPFDKQGQAKLF